jgi:glycosyltransferase involved in cell wall biosynthesis
MELVSVIIPTHNRKKMLLKALDSVLNQTYKNLEILIIDDFSIDSTNLLMKSIDDNRIKYIQLLSNVGGAEARNIGIRAAKGEYISFLDDDDEWFENKIKEQVSVLKNRDDVAIVSSNYFLSNGNKDILNQCSISEILLDDLLYSNYCGSFSFCMTKKNYIQNLFINNDLKSCQDWDLWLKVLMTTKLKSIVINKPLVRYYIGHENKLTNNFKNSYFSYLIFLRYYWGFMNSNQKNYNLYKLTKMKRKFIYNQLSYFSNIHLFFKSLKFYYLSNYNQTIYNYLLILLQLIPKKLNKL